MISIHLRKAPIDQDEELIEWISVDSPEIDSNNTRGNKSPRLLPQNLPLWPILTMLFLI